MRRVDRQALVAVLTMVLSGIVLLPGSAHAAPARTLAAPGARAPAATVPPEAREIRSLYTREMRVDRPVGLAWSPAEKSLLVLGQAAGTSGTSAVRAATDGELKGRTPLPPIGDQPNVAYDARTETLSSVAGTELIRVPAKPGESAGAPQHVDLRPLGLRAPRGLTYDDGGALYILDAGAGDIVRVAAGAQPTDAGAVSRIPLTALGGKQLAGLAYNARDGRFYVAEPRAGRLHGVKPEGGSVTSYDISRVGVRDLRGMQFAPTADPTDSPAATDLYIADAGSGQVLGRVAQVSLTAAAAAETPNVSANLVRMINTAAWSPPSPDPSGISYIPGSNRLLIGDGEVDEMSIYQNVNLWQTSLTGTVVASQTGTTVPWSNEPVGAGYRSSNGHMFISDDDKDTVFDVAAGPDGKLGTADDVVKAINTSSFGNRDPEGVEIDDATGDIWTVDGTANDVFHLSPTGSFIARYDVGQYGAVDPEGIGIDQGRGSLFVVDDSSQAVYELTKTGALLNTISIAAAKAQKAAGMTIAPASNGSGGMNLYITDRGVDNDSNPTENDGKIYEMSVTLPSTGNAAPTVSAGTDQTVILPDSATLTGIVRDDGRPNPPGSVSTTWSKVSGPGTVTFGTPTAPTTTASFSVDGTYVVRLRADDSALSASDDVTVVVKPAGSAGTLDIPVATSTDDAEERPSGGVTLDSADLELVTDGTTVQTVGLRFAGVNVPRGANITNAYVQFNTDEVSTGAASLTIKGQAADNASTFTTASGNVSSRTATSASVSWSPPDWPTVNARGPAQRTPSLAAIVQEIVNRAGWASGNAIAFKITGSGRRTTDAADAGPAPVLHIEHGGTGGGGGPTNSAPVVNAGADVSVTLPDTASLSGSVTDDGLPNPPGSVTSQWSKASGPGTVTFADASAASTTASFSAAGTYVLRLTGADGALTTTDATTVSVAPEGGGGGTTTTLDIPVRAASDDVEQASTGTVDLASSDLELVTDRGAVQTVGLRFTGVTVPAGATVTNAYVQFTVDEVLSNAGSPTLQLRGQAADNPATFTTAANDVSSRPTTAAAVTWSPAAWPTVGAASTGQRTPDLSAVVAEIVGRSGWASGNALTLVVTQASGSPAGSRVATSFNGTAAPVLHLEYTS